MRLIAPPLPPASRPSNTTSSPGPELPAAELAAEMQAQLEQAPLRVGQALLVLRPGSAPR